MRKSNYHTHTTFCDGKDTPEDLILQAINLNCEEIGFSGHSYTFFDESYCMSKKGTADYKECILKLKEKYKEKINILLGVEQDYFSDEPTDDYDYVIGSVHYVKKDGVYLPVDESKELQIKAVKEHYNGDFYSFIEDYYELVGDIYNKTKCDVIGHFDLITKFNEGNTLFDTNNERYKNAVKKAIDNLINSPAVFEINTGAIARGYKKTPYPNKEIIDYLTSKNKKLIYNSDCHDKKDLLFGL